MVHSSALYLLFLLISTFSFFIRNSRVRGEPDAHPNTLHLSLTMTIEVKVDMPAVFTVSDFDFCDIIRFVSFFVDSCDFYRGAVYKYLGF